MKKFNKIKTFGDLVVLSAIVLLSTLTTSLTYMIMPNEFGFWFGLFLGVVVCMILYVSYLAYKIENR